MGLLAEELRPSFWGKHVIAALSALAGPLKLARLGVGMLSVLSVAQVISIVCLLSLRAPASYYLGTLLTRLPRLVIAPDSVVPKYLHSLPVLARLLRRAAN